jgi:chromosome segregation ATPase
VWKKLSLGLFLVFLLSSSVVYADVVLTDEQAQELDQTLDELETVLKEQQTTINDLETTCEQQRTKINELKDSLEEQNKSSVKQNILTVTISVLVGVLIGMLL